jgi:signal transduction histidine kinase
MYWRLGFGSLVMAVIGFAIWSVLLVVRVRVLRMEVEASVGCLQQATALQRSTSAAIEGGGRTLRDGWNGAADAMVELAAEGLEGDSGSALRRTLVAIDAARAQPSPASLEALRTAIDQLIGQLRRDNAGRSATLGASWGALSFVVFTALLLAALVVVLVALVERRRRQALGLAAEIEATAEALAETRAALRAQEAVALLADELRVARDRAEEASATKTRFMATMSHELLTPLNIILGYAELVRERCEEHALAEVSGDVDRLEEAAQGLFRLLRHVLDITELDSGVFQIAFEDVEVGALLARAAEDARPVAARNGTSVTLEVPATLRVRCDRRRLETVVAEAVGNACRFTRRGHVTLRASAAPEGALVEVEDDGPGMRPEDCERATTPFFQADGSATRAHDGAGLGLTVASRLCARMGGTLELRSAPGAGTTVRIRLPAQPPA